MAIWFLQVLPTAAVMFKSLLITCAFALNAAAAFPPKPTGLTVVESLKFPGVSISFKEVVQFVL